MMVNIIGGINQSRRLKPVVTYWSTLSLSCPGIKFKTLVV